MKNDWQSIDTAPRKGQHEMSETRTVHDPFFGRDVQISDRLTDRLRGKYACGPTLPNGEPEFGWRQVETPPIQHAAASRIEALEKALEKAESCARMAVFSARNNALDEDAQGRAIYEHAAKVAELIADEIGDLRRASAIHDKIKEG